MEETAGGADGANQLIQDQLVFVGLTPAGGQETLGWCLLWGRRRPRVLEERAVFQVQTAGGALSLKAVWS